MQTIFGLFKKVFDKWTGRICLGVAVLVLAVDYFTGKHIEFPVLYALPVGMAAWREKKSIAWGIAVALPLARVGFHFLWHDTFSVAIVCANAPITTFSLLLYAYLIERIAWQTRALQKELKVLQGMLPICASCKRIRDTEGEYEPIEKYLVEHTEASFTHGICPECARRLYPELYPEYFQDKDGPSLQKQDENDQQN